MNVCALSGRQNTCVQELVGLHEVSGDMKVLEMIIIYSSTTCRLGIQRVTLMLNFPRTVKNRRKLKTDRKKNVGTATGDSTQPNATAVNLSYIPARTPTHPPISM